MIPKLHSDLDELIPGSTLGKYEILRKLATGGMAELYLARARGVAGFEKTVVLKRILPQVAEDETFVQMFLDEARLAATLQHPNIADVYDVGEAGGTPFFTMEYVHGQDVRSIRAATRKRNEQVPIAMALAIVHGTASALDYAHGRTSPDGRPLELVHRDVSSSNIVVSYDGAIKLLDFGIARATSHQHKTQVGTLKGKTPYMSPEQCRGLPLDRRSDLFSLGTVMFELTVGRRPFGGASDFAVMEQLVHGEAPRPSALIQGYPAELEAIVLRLLSRRVEDRYQTAEEMLHDLEGFISQHGLWVSSRPLGKYMRLLFADRIDAWERAADEGVSLGEHLAETITSESQRSDPSTPAPAYPRLLRLSQEIPAVGLPSMQMAAVQPASEPEDLAPEDATVADPVAIAGPAPVYAGEPELHASAPPVYANLQAAPAVAASQQHAMFDDSQPTAFERPSARVLSPSEPPALRRSPRPAAVALGALMLAGVVAAAVVAWPRESARPAATSEPAAATESAPASPDPAARRARVPTAAGPAEPAARVPTAAGPEDPAAQTATAAATEPDEAAAPQSAPADGAPPEAPSTAPPPPAPAAAPTPTAGAPARAPTSRPSRPSKPGKPGKPPKDDAWDRDSPFLPPSN